MADHIDYLKKIGYTDAAHPMSGKVGEWWGWYNATDDWYSSVEQSADGRQTFVVERLTIKPARMVCQEWASLLLNERTVVTVEDEKTNAWLEQWLLASSLLDNAPRLVERTFALGAGAWALRLQGAQASRIGSKLLPSAGARIVPQRFDARQVIPLSYDEDTCTECAFVNEVMYKGRRLEQMQIHVLEGRGYAIYTVMLDSDGKVVSVPGVLPKLNTGSDVPLFALTRPALENPYDDYSPFGVSVFDDAIGAVKLVDTAVDSMWRDIYLGQKMVFLDERMLEKDSLGNVTVPRAKDQQLFRAAEYDPNGGSLIEEYNPELRVEDNRLAITTGRELLGSRCGLGAVYFSLESASGVAATKTATEVISEDSDLYRNVKKHGNALVPSVQAIITGVLSLARLTGAPISDDFGEVRVMLDDSVIEDTASKRKQDLADVASGIMSPWEFRAKWYGEDESTARTRVAEAASTLPLEE